MATNQNILSFLNDEDEIKLGERILDLAETVQERKDSRATHFLNPRDQKIAEKILSQIMKINFKSWGGHPKAERERILIFPDFLFPEHQEVPLVCLNISGNFEYVNVDHSDFLGAILGLGIKRERVGDIFIYKDSAQIVTTPELEEEILLNLDRVNEVPVEVEIMRCEDIVFEESNRKEIKATVASLRLDAVLSAGFGESRSRSKRAVQQGKVKLNWRQTSDPAAEIEIGDLISFSGRGRLKVAEDRGISNSGRKKLLLERIT